MTTAPLTHDTSGERDKAAVLWITQALSGLFLIAVLSLHMVAHHFVVEGGLRNFEQVIQYVTNPLVFGLELVFVVVATVHALLGVRAIILDMGLAKSSQRVADWALILVGAATVAYGLWLAVALQQIQT